MGAMLWRYFYPHTTKAENKLIHEIRVAIVRPHVADVPVCR